MESRKGSNIDNESNLKTTSSSELRADEAATQESAVEATDVRQSVDTQPEQARVAHKVTAQPSKIEATAPDLGTKPAESETEAPDLNVSSSETDINARAATGEAGASTDAENSTESRAGLGTEDDAKRNESEGNTLASAATLAPSPSVGAEEKDVESSATEESADESRKARPGTDLDPVMKDIYLGVCGFKNLPPLHKKVVRIFVSSTFSGNSSSIL